MNYLLRVTPVQCTKSGAQVFDELFEKSLRHRGSVQSFLCVLVLLYSSGDITVVSRKGKS